MMTRGLGVLLFALPLACAPTLEERIEEIETLHAQGRYAETLESLSALLDDSPGNPKLNRLYGVAQVGTGNSSLAVWPLRKATEHPEAGLDEFLLLARAYISNRALGEALEVLEHVLAVEPDRLEALQLHTGIALESNRFDDALESADRILVLERRPSAHIQRAKALAGLSRFAEAFAALEPGMPPDSPWGASWRLSFCIAGVEVAETEGDEQKLEDRWEACLAEFPAAAELVDGAVAFFDRKQQPERAIAVLETALEVAPHRDLRAKLARRLAAAGRKEEAERVILAATQTGGDPSDAWISVGDYYRAQREFAAAAHATEQVLRAREAVHPLVLAQYADDLLQAGELAKAEEVIGVVDRPEYAALLRGRLLLLRGEPEAALLELEEGLRVWTGNATARYLIGQAAERLGEFDRAVAAYREAIRTGPELTDAVFALARLYEAERRFDAAVGTLRLRLVKQPADRRANAELARIATERGRAPIANEAIRRLAETPGGEAAAAVALARQGASLRGSAAGAESLEASGLDLTRLDSLDALRALVEYQLDDDQHEEALTRLRVAIEAHPDFAPFRVLQASVLEAGGHPREHVREALEAALARDPESGGALQGLAALAVEEGQVEGALDLYDQAALADPEDPAPRWQAVQLARSAGQDAEVDARLAVLLDLHPIHAPAASLLAERLLAQGSDLERAAALAARATRFGRSAETLALQGRVALERGEVGRAIRSLSSAVRIQPESPSTRYQLARALLAAERDEAARQQLEESLAGADFAEASAARDELARLEAELGDG